MRREGGKFRGASQLWSGAVKDSVLVVRGHALEKSELDLEWSSGAPEKHSGLSLHFITGLFWLQFWQEGKMAEGTGILI